MVQAAMGGSALGNLTQLGNQSVAFGISRQQQSDSWDQWKRSLKKGKVYEMEGLRRAGINPIIAAGGTFLGGTAKALLNPPNTAGAGAPGRNAMLDAAQISQASEGARLAGEQADATNAQNVYYRGQADFYNSARGKRVIAQEAYHKSLPTTAVGAAIMGGAMGYQNAKDWLQNEIKQTQQDIQQRNRSKLDSESTKRGGTNFDVNAYSREQGIPTLEIRPK